MESVDPAEAEAGFGSLAGELVPRLAQIGSKTPSGSVIHIVTGALSAMLRKRASLSRNATSTCFRSLKSLNLRNEVKGAAHLHPAAVRR